MTSLQKQRIEYLRSQGKSYAVISDVMSVPENTVKSYCRRHGLGAGFAVIHADHVADLCDNCNKPLQHSHDKKKKRFCSFSCRMKWWAAHPEAVNRKAIYHSTCSACGGAFSAYGNAHRKYCSRACFGKAIRKRSYE